MEASMPAVKGQEPVMFLTSAELLEQYRDAALVNSQSLLEEATLLLVHGHYARAYFLATSSIEESGKAVQAFEGLGRNLSDSAVTRRLKLQFEDHSQKVTSAFSACCRPRRTFATRS
jgi:AbiV family abortive infection protein